MPSPLYVATLVERCCRNQHIKQLHAQLLVTGLFASDDFLLNKLLRRCGHLGNITYARQLFDGIPQPNVFLWTALVHGHVENQLYREALILYRSMLTNCVTPLSYTISSVLKASLGLSELQHGESIHGQVLKLGLDSDLISSNTILDFYSKSKRFDHASKLFGGMLLKDVLSWNVMIRCCCDSGDMGRARILFDEMPERNVVSWTTMICGYIKQRNMNAADCLFGQMDDRDAASWNVLIHGYVDSGDLRSARDFFDSAKPGSWNVEFID